MASRLPPLHALQAFEAISRLGSFALAAQELHLTHSAISHQMRALEESLQTSLIDRSRRTLALTPNGKLFLAVVGPALEQLVEVTDEIRRPAASRLRVSVVPSFAARWLLSRLGDFISQHPELELDISTTQSLVSLDKSGINLAIRYGGGKWPGVSAELLFEEKLFPVASPTYLRIHRISSVEDLLNGTLLRDDFHPWKGWLERASIDIQDCRFGPVYRDSALTLQAAEAGQGVALASSWLVADALRTGSLSRIGTVCSGSSSAYYLVYPRGGRAAPAVRQFCAWIKGAGAVSSVNVAE